MGDQSLYNIFLERIINIVIYFSVMYLGFAYRVFNSRKPLLYIGFTARAVSYALLGFLIQFTHMDIPSQNPLYNLVIIIANVSICCFDGYYLS